MRLRYLLLASALVFGPGLTGDYVWDDNVLLRDNELVHSLGHLKSALTGDFWQTSDPDLPPAGFYRPVVKVLFLLEYAVFGGHPAGFKAVNLALHLGCVLLAFGWLRRRLRGAGANEQTAGLAAVVGCIPFALHPSRAESVSWISGSTDLWMTFWVLVGLTLWDKRRSGLGAAAAAGALVLAFFSKEAALVTPILLGLDLLWAKRPGGWRDLGIVALALAGAAALRSTMVSFRYAPVLGEGVARAAARVAASLGLLLERALWPWTPSVQAGALPTGPDGAFLFPTHAVVLGGVALAFLAGLAVLALRRPPLRAWAADAGWFVLPLVPVLNLVPLNYKTLVAERFLYWPLLGAAALLGRALLPWLTGPSPRRVAVLGTAGALALAYAVVCAGHVGHFQSDRELWTYERDRDPRDPYAADMLARTLWQEGELEEALRNAEEAVVLAKTPDERVKVAVLWAYIRQDAAAPFEAQVLEQLRELLDGLASGAPKLRVPLPGGALEVEPSAATRVKLVQSPRFATQRAILHARTDDLPGAEALFRELLSRFPSRPSVQVNLARVLAWQERFDSSRQLLAAVPEGAAFAEAVVRVEGKVASAGMDELARSAARGEGLVELGAPVEALRIVASALAAHPGDPRLVRAAVRAHRAEGRPDRANQVLEAARTAAPQREPEWEVLRRELR